MVGSNTIRTDDPSLNVRYAEGASPLRVVTASKGALPASAKVLTDGGRTLIAVSALAERETVDQLLARGVEVFGCGGSRVDLQALMSELWRRGVRKVLVEGGATLLAMPSSI